MLPLRLYGRVHEVYATGEGRQGCETSFGIRKVIKATARLLDGEAGQDRCRLVVIPSIQTDRLARWRHQAPQSPPALEPHLPGNSPLDQRNRFRRLSPGFCCNYTPRIRVSREKRGCEGYNCSKI